MSQDDSPAPDHQAVFERRFPTWGNEPQVSAEDNPAGWVAAFCQLAQAGRRGPTSGEDECRSHHDRRLDVLGRRPGTGGAARREHRPASRGKAFGG